MNFIATAVANAPILAARLCARELNKNNAALREKHLGIAGKEQNTDCCGVAAAVGCPNFKQQLAGRERSGLAPLFAALQVILHNGRIQIRVARPGNQFRFKFGRIFAVGQVADFVAGERAVAGAAAHQHPAIVQRVQVGTARHLHADERALAGFYLLPAGGHRRAAETGGFQQSAFGLFFPNGVNGTAVFVQPQHNQAAVAVGQGHQALRQRFGLGLGQKGQPLSRLLF